MFVKNDGELKACFSGGEYRKDMYPVTLLRTERLNQDLYDFLLDQEFDGKRIRFILKQGKFNAVTQNLSAC